MAGKPGMRQPKRTQAEKDAVALGIIEGILDGQAAGLAHCAKCGNPFEVKELNQTQIKALEIRYNKIRPSLSTIEQRLIDPGEKLTDGQIIVQLHSLITSSPTVLGTLLGLLVQADRGAVERALVAQDSEQVIAPSSPVSIDPVDGHESQSFVPASSDAAQQSAT